MATVDEWRQRLRQAQEQYIHASATAAKLKHSQSESDEEFEQALRAERQARDEYMTVLGILTRVLDGEKPTA